MAAAQISSIAFPVSESPGAGPSAPSLRPHLPFRRISLPTAPTAFNRHSVVSVASVDSISGNVETRGGRRTARPPSVESPMRRQRRRDSSTRPAQDPERAAKARKIVDEFYETEKSYVQGLEMVYSHFLAPIILSLDTPEPLLDRTTINSIFSNFIDIWNLHRSFFSALESLLSQSKEGPVAIAPLLVSHFPYLSLYNPFITAFPSIITSLSELSSPPTALRPNPNYNAVFADFLTRQEKDPRCGKLKLRDWLLTIVQRCPRYLLLLKDLISATSQDDPEHDRLVIAHGLVSKITNGLNSSLHNHAQTLALLALQRATTNLPFQFITPGRTLVKRGPLFQAERNALPRPREFLLFSDCLVWLASTDSSSNLEWGGNTAGGGVHTPSSSAPPPRPPPLLRSRSRSEAELPRQIRLSTGPMTPQNRKRQSYHPPPAAPPPMPRRGTSASSDERWVYKGKVELVDLEVTVGSILDEDYSFEILSPEESFIVYAASEESRDEWVSAIRTARSELLSALNATNPHSTLTSSTSTKHIRRSLQALPFHPSDERLATLRGPGSQPTSPNKTSKENFERRRKVDPWVPPPWVPDGKTTECMRCGKIFGWKRRRHHCRLCGRCVCNACSGKTFFIVDTAGKGDGTKSARACDVCYESVFPVVEASSQNGPSQIEDDTITSLSKLPSWFSMPSVPSSVPPQQPQALMAIERSTFVNEQLEGEPSPLPEDNLEGKDKDPLGVIKLRPHQKLRSYHEILEDFEAHERGGIEEVQRYGVAIPDKQSSGPGARDHEDGLDWMNEDEGAEREREEYLRSRLFFTPPSSAAPSPQTSPVKRKEDTMRRKKRFSLPAVALQTTQVMARASLVIEDVPISSSALGVGGIGVSKGSSGLRGGWGEDDSPTSNTATTPVKQQRFSVVLSPSKSGYNSPANKRGSVVEPVREEGEDGAAALERSMAANKLSELLGKSALRD